MTFTHISLLNLECRFSIVRDVILLVGYHLRRKVSLISDFRPSLQSQQGIYYYNCEKKYISSGRCQDLNILTGHFKFFQSKFI